MPSGTLKKIDIEEKVNPVFIILAFGAGALLASMLLKKKDEKKKNVEGMQNSCKLKSP
tara:strand:+ start:606 stop:779 length:174 start_codon:yes stop_codon:yes gene_type:complete